MTNGSLVRINIGEVHHVLGKINLFGVLDPVALGLLDIGKEILAALLGELVKHNHIELVGCELFLAR